VKTKTEIIEAIAKDRMVETMVTNIAHKPMSADLEDLSQMVYLILLEYDEKKLQDLWENNQMHFFIARIIINQYNSVNSPFHTIFRKFRRMIDEDISVAIGQYSKMDVEEADIMDTYRVLKNED
jgi:thioesterase domain-containing protein